VKYKDASYECDVLQGTMKIHFIVAIKKTNLIQLLVGNLASFCSFSLQGNWDKCPNLE
jgi:hypothetical protein